MRHRLVRATFLVWLGVAIVAPAGRASLQTTKGSAPKPSAGPGADAVALQRFSESVANYVALRKKISAEIPPIPVTPRASEITAGSDALARAVERARPNARQGSFFSPEIAGAFRRTLELALRQTDRAALLALINEEPGALKRPTVHMRFPAGDILATTPAALLQALPSLPKELEYRFVGRVLILRDIDAALVLDYISPALPAQ
jgi:hypothetical protein